MAALSPEVQALVRAQRLGFVATVNADGTPNLSPKGTLTVLDDDHLIFADLDSPGTVANLRRDPRVDVSVVSPATGIGYRATGTGRVVERGPELERIRRFYADGPLDVGREAGATIRAAVVIDVDAAREVRIGRDPGDRPRPASTRSRVSAVIGAVLAIPALMYELFDWFVWNNRPPAWAGAVAVAVLAGVAVAVVRRRRARPPTWTPMSADPPGRTPETVLRETRLVHVATVGEDGRPHVVPMRGAHVRPEGLVLTLAPESGTAANLRERPSLHVNVVDPILRKGFRLSGAATLDEMGSTSTAVLTTPTVRPLISPGYRDGMTEEAMRRRWREHYASAEGKVSGARAAAILGLSALAGLVTGLALFLVFGRDPRTPWYEGLPWAVLGAVAGAPLFGAIPLAAAARRAGKSA